MALTIKMQLKILRLYYSGDSLNGFKHKSGHRQSYKQRSSYGRNLLQYRRNKDAGCHNLLP